MKKAIFHSYVKLPEDNPKQHTKHLPAIFRAMSSQTLTVTVRGANAHAANHGPVNEGMLERPLQVVQVRHLETFVLNYLVVSH